MRNNLSVTPRNNATKLFYAVEVGKVHSAALSIFNITGASYTERKPQPGLIKIF